MKFFIKKYSAIIALIALAVYDALVLILRHNFHRVFWLAFIAVQVAFVAYILVKLFVKQSDEERGINPLGLTLFFFIVVMVLMSFLGYLLKDTHAAFLGMMIGYIIFTGLAAVLIVFSLLNKAVVKQNTNIKPQVVDEEDLLGVLNGAYELVKDEAAKKQIGKIIERLQGAEIDEKSLEGKKLIEYAGFVYKNAKRGEMNNIFYNIKKVDEALDRILGDK